MARKSSYENPIFPQGEMIMQVITSGKLNKDEAKKMLSEWFSAELGKALLEKFPQLQGVFEDGLLTAEMKVGFSEKIDQRITIFEEEDWNDAAASLRLASTCYEDVKMEIVKGKEENATVHPQKSDTPINLNPMLAKGIHELDMSIRTTNCLERWCGITTIAELVSKTADELLEIRNFGETCLNEVIAKLRQHNLKLR